MQQRNNWEFIQRSLDIKSTIKYKNNGCTRQAANPQHIAKNWLNRQFHASMPNEKWNLAGKIDLIVTESVSRFARNTADSLSSRIIPRTQNHTKSKSWNYPCFLE